MPNLLTDLWVVMLGFKLVAGFSGIVAGLCILIFPVWILGIPGIDNEYARGWNMGLNVILLYPVACALNYIPYLFVRGRLSRLSLLRWQQVVTAIAIALFLLAAVRMSQALKIIF